MIGELDFMACDVCFGNALADRLCTSCTQNKLAIRKLKCDLKLVLENRVGIVTNPTVSIGCTHREVCKYYNREGS